MATYVEKRRNVRSGAERSVGGAGASDGAGIGAAAEAEGLRRGDALLRCLVSERRRSKGGGERGQLAGSARGGGGVLMRGGDVPRGVEAPLSAMTAAPRTLERVGARAGRQSVCQKDVLTGDGRTGVSGRRRALTATLRYGADTS